MNSPTDQADPSITAVIDDLEAKRYAAMIDGDVQALNSLLSSDMIYVHSTNVIETKDEAVKMIGEGRANYKSIERSNAVTRLSGDGTAVVSANVKIEVEVDGTPISLDLIQLAVWARAGDGWRLASVQSTPVRK